MQERHFDTSKYFNEQKLITSKYVIPFIGEDIRNKMSVLEIGCGYGGNLATFSDMDCQAVGVDISQKSITKAIKLSEENVGFIWNDIFDVGDIGQFDVIMMRDVLEHIHGHDKLLKLLKSLLKPTGVIFISFPPWYSPFGGHQQMCESRLLSAMPYFHLLPRWAYKFILKIFGESETKINGLLEIKKTGITIEKFERLLKAHDYIIKKKTHYFINPSYEVKFGLRKRVSSKLISWMPYIRDFFITTTYYNIY